jgi:spermidine synthase
LFETLGTLIGGLALTILTFVLPIFWIVFWLCLVNALALFFLVRHGKNRIIAFITGMVIICLCIGLLVRLPDRLQKLNLNFQQKGAVILDARTSVYGSILVSQKNEQYTFYYNGNPFIVLPHPDWKTVEDLAHFALLSHRSPNKVLIIGAGAGGLISEILKYPVEKIDYAELDPVLMALLRTYTSPLTRYELNNPRVHVLPLDGRLYLRETQEHYDVIIVGVSTPFDLSSNRYFTKEFFALLKTKLTPGGTLLFRIPGSLTYLGREIINFDVSIIRACAYSFLYCLVIPGEDTLVLASDSPSLQTLSPDVLSGRMKEKGIVTRFISPAYIAYRLQPNNREWFMNALDQVLVPANQDFLPRAVFEMLLYWNKMFSPFFGKIMESIRMLNFFTIGGFILLLAGALQIFGPLKVARDKMAYSYSIFTTGFYGMFISMILLFCFQVLYGYVYAMLAIMISIFMVGITCGSLWSIRMSKRIPSTRGLFFALEWGIVVFVGITGTGILYFKNFISSHPYIFVLLFFIAGLFVGLEFPLFIRLLSRGKENREKLVGWVYFLDLLGGCLGGVLGGIVLLPVLGLMQSLGVLAILKLSSITLVALNNKGADPF